MTSPLSPEAVAQMVADREAGTPGPWEAYDWVSRRVRHAGVIGGGLDILSLSNLKSPLRSEDETLANLSRLTRLPQLEAAHLTLSAENATLRAELDAALERVRALETICRDVEQWWVGGAMEHFIGAPFCMFALRASLTPTADKE